MTESILERVIIALWDDRLLFGCTMKFRRINEENYPKLGLSGNTGKYQPSGNNKALPAVGLYYCPWADIFRYCPPIQLLLR